MHLDEIARDELPMFLECERREGTIWLRRFQRDALADAALHPDAFDVLEVATLAGELDSAWLGHLLANATASELGKLASSLLLAMLGDSRHRPLSIQLCETVALTTPTPSEFAEAALEALTQSMRGSDGQLAALLLRAVSGLGRERVLRALPGVWPLIPVIEAPRDRDALLDAFTGTGGGALRPGDLFDDDGQARACWLLAEPWVNALLKVPGAFESAAPETLAAAARACRDPGTRTTILWPLLDRAAFRDTPRAVAAIVASGLWRTWSRRDEWTGELRRSSALFWLMSAGHASRRVNLTERLPREWWPAAGDGTPYRSAPATMESWHAAMDDLGEGLDSHLMSRITTDEAHWPPIYPFERRQMLDLAERAEDLGALAMLIDDSTRPALAICGALPKHLVDQSRFAGRIDERDLYWLCVTDKLLDRRSEVPGLAASKLLCDHAGSRISQGMQARVISVLHAIAVDPCSAISAAATPPLWADRGFRRGLRQHLRRLDDSAALSTLGDCLENTLAISGIDAPPSAGQPRGKASEWLLSQGFVRAAWLTEDEPQ